MLKQYTVQQYSLYTEACARCLSVYPSRDMICNSNVRKPNLNPLLLTLSVKKIGRKIDLCLTRQKPYKRVAWWFDSDSLTWIKLSLNNTVFFGFLKKESINVVLHLNYSHFPFLESMTVSQWLTQRLTN